MGNHPNSGWTAPARVNQAAPATEWSIPRRFELRVFNPPSQDVLDGRKISSARNDLIRHVRDAGNARGLKLFHAMPWILVSEESAGTSGEANREMPRRTERMLPVLMTGSAGVSTDPGYFSDSNPCLTREGSAARSYELGRALRSALDSGTGRQSEDP